MSTGLKKLNGADKVDVSLEQGLAKIQLKPENKITLSEIQNVVKKNGFSAKGAKVKLKGKLRNQKDAVLLTVTGSNESVPATVNQSFDPEKEYWIEGVLKIEKNDAQSLAISVLKE